MIISHVSYMLMIAQSLLMRQKKPLYLYSNVGTIFVFLEMYVFLIAFSLVNGWISHTLYLCFFYRSCTPSPKPPTVSKSSHRQALSAVEAYTKLLQEQSMTCFRNSQQTEKAQEKQQDHSPQVSGLLHSNVQDTKCITERFSPLITYTHF